MQLRRLLGLSGETSRGRTRRSYTRPPASPSPRAPPNSSSPWASSLPAAATAPALTQSKSPSFAGFIDRATSDGFLLRGVYENDVARVVCNPLTGQLFRLPDIGGARSEASPGGAAGLLTQADRGDGHGPPDRYAVIEVGVNGHVMHRFLSETGRWEAMPSFFSSLPFGRSTIIDHPPVAFGGRMWWIDLGWGAVSFDPFADEPDFCIVALPTGSVLPAEASGFATRRKLRLSRYRRVGVSDGRLRYVEVSASAGAEPFELNSFVLDEAGNRWTLVSSGEPLADGRQLCPDGSHIFAEAPFICCIDPLKGHVVYLMAGPGNQVVIGVDMETGLVTGASLLDQLNWLTPCLLPPWLGSCQIPSSGKNNVKNEALAEILVRSDRAK
ncbi:uncharacterized protein LOC127774248 [Oryza glaberrima]|uniref:uncharacterized protein LOC127774248 n=1 Tax=Oryza glaberrima TaxID=4538 RepID=UPI00224BFE68|nr:uncharacterized protein LOC127774248 [Oryza glaberrima]